MKRGADMRSARLEVRVGMRDPNGTSVNSALTPQSAAMACATSNMMPLRLFVLASRKPWGGLDDVMTTLAAPCFFTSARATAAAGAARLRPAPGAARVRRIDGLRGGA